MHFHYAIIFHRKSHARRRGRMNEWNERRFDKREQERMTHSEKIHTIKLLKREVEKINEQ